MEKLNIKALVFDMDGLLIDSERIVKESWDMAGQELGYGKIGSKHILNTLGMNRNRRNAYFREQEGVDFPFEKFRQLDTFYFWDIVKKEGIPLKKGVLELLTTAKEKGYRIALATSSHKAYAENVLDKQHGILHYFEVIICGDMITYSKPHPEIYLKAALELGVKPEECFGIEDAPNGVRAVCAAGMHAIMVPDLKQPDAEILSMVYRKFESLDQVIDLL